MIPKDTIDRIYAEAIIEEVVGEFLQLKKSGTTYRALSPFSSEKTPSFYVVPHKGIFKDFSSGKGGNVVTFLMEHERMSYVEALKWLGDKYNIEIEETKPSEEQQQAASERENLGVVVNYASGYFSDVLWNNPQGQTIGLSYLRERGFRDEIIRKFDLGFCLEDWTAFTDAAIEKGYSLEYLVKSGLTKQKGERNYDFFRGRVMFPIHSLSGKPIAFGGRTLRSDKKVAKYYNSPESELYHKSKVLYGMHLAKGPVLKEDLCYIVEGYTDVISMVQNGVDNVVASAGTALTEDQIRLIKRYTKNVTILFDGDAAGIRASFRGIDLILAAEMNVRVVLFPDGEDPDSFASKTPTTELHAFLEDSAEDFMKFKTRMLLGESGDDPIRRAEMIGELVKSIAIIPNASRREVYIQECSRLVGITERTLMLELNKVLRANFKREHKTELAGVEIPLEKPKEVEEQKLDVQHQERDLIRLLLTYGHYVMKLPPADQPEVKVKRGQKPPEKPDPIEVCVAEYLLGELEEDDLEFSDTRFRQIAAEYTGFLEEGALPPEHHFFTHPDPELSSLTASIVADQFTLSENWSVRHKIYTEREIELLEHAVKSSVYKFKLRLIELRLKETEKELEVPGMEPEAQQLILSKIMVLNRAKMTLAAQSETVIVH
ncbi:MAG: DNA primase [Flavobacteriales bacterium]